MKDIISFFIAVYIVMSALAVFGGIMGRNWKCLEKPARIEKFFPAYEFSCYLFGDSGKPHYYKEE